MKEFKGPSRQFGFWGAVIGGLIGALGSKKAADTQVGASRDAQAATERLTAPYRGAGEQVLNPLVDLALKGPETELTRAEGFRNIQNSAAAQGKLHSGGTLAGLTQFNNMLNEQQYATRFNSLFNLATMGANASTNQATQTSNLITGAGNAQAAGYAGIANAGTNAINNFTFLDMLKNRGGAGQSIGGYTDSDARLKTNVQKIGEYNGLNVYEWDWNAEGLARGNEGNGIGVMAHEAPAHAVRMKDGYMQVNYGAL